jgi:hypothetical protein
LEPPGRHPKCSCIHILDTVISNYITAYFALCKTSIWCGYMPFQLNLPVLSNVGSMACHSATGELRFATAHLRGQKGRSCSGKKEKMVLVQIMSSNFVSIFSFPRKNFVSILPSSTKAIVSIPRLSTNRQSASSRVVLQLIIVEGLV